MYGGLSRNDSYAEKKTLHSFHIQTSGRFRAAFLLVIIPAPEKSRWQQILISKDIDENLNTNIHLFLNFKTIWETFFLNFYTNEILLP